MTNRSESAPATSPDAKDGAELVEHVRALTRFLGQLSEEVVGLRTTLAERENLQDHIDSKFEALTRLLGELDEKQTERLSRVQHSIKKYAIADVMQQDSCAAAANLHVREEGDVANAPRKAVLAPAGLAAQAPKMPLVAAMSAPRELHAEQALISAGEDNTHDEKALKDNVISTTKDTLNTELGKEEEDSISHDVSIASGDACTEPVCQEKLLIWARTVGETFNARAFLIELLGQSAWSFFGPPLLPLLYLLYGRSWAALSNRFMWPSNRWRAKIFVFHAIMSLMTLVFALTYTFMDGCREIDVSVFIAIFACILLRVSTIAIKYASMPASVYRHLNREEWSDKELNEVLVMGWYHVDPCMAERTADMSFLSVLGPTPQELILRFTSPEKHEDAQAMCLQQGRMTRFIANKILFEQGCTGCSRQVIDEGLSAALTPAFKNLGWVRRREMPLRMFFKRLTQAILEMEHSSRSAQVLLIPNRVLESLVILLSVFPIIVLVLDGRRPWAFSAGAQVHLAMSWFPTWFSVRANLYFLSTAVRDMWRRRTIMRCCVALLSSNLLDRELVPAEVRCLGILNMHDSQTVEASRLLFMICKDWGSFFGRRCTIFFGVFTAVTGIMMVWMTIAIQAGLLAFLSRQLLYVVVFFSVPLAYAILLLVFFGEGANAAADRIGALLQKHHAALQSYATCTRIPPSASSDPMKLKLASKLLRSATRSALAIAEKEPFTLLGMYCGYRLVTAMYIVPAFMASTIATHCASNPDMCKPDVPW